MQLLDDRLYFFRFYRLFQTGGLFDWLGLVGRPSVWLGSGFLFGLFLGLQLWQFERYPFSAFADHSLGLLWGRFHLQGALPASCRHIFLFRQFRLRFLFLLNLLMLVFLVFLLNILPFLLLLLLLFLLLLLELFLLPDLGALGLCPLPQILLSPPFLFFERIRHLGESSLLLL